MIASTEAYVKKVTCTNQRGQIRYTPRPRNSEKFISALLIFSLRFTKV